MLKNIITLKVVLGRIFVSNISVQYMINYCADSAVFIEIVCTLYTKWIWIHYFNMQLTKYTMITDVCFKNAFVRNLLNKQMFEFSYICPSTN